MVESAVALIILVHANCWRDADDSSSVGDAGVDLGLDRRVGRGGGPLILGWIWR